ncbi:MAG: ComEC/Rec2 family competence protein, partial [Gammaproteobacteria bacterium]
MKLAAAGFLGGAAILAVIPGLPAIEISVAILASGAVASILKRVALAGCIAAGFGAASLAGSSALSDRISPRLAGKDILLAGIVTSIPSGKAGALKFTFEGRAARSNEAIPGRVRLSWYNAPAVPVPGERWQLLVRLRQPTGNINPGGFDYERWLLREQIGALGYVRRSTKNKRLDESAGSWLAAYRYRLAEQMEDKAGDRPFVDVLKAISIGYRGDMPRDHSTVFRKTGTGHLLAISGLHVGIAAFLGIFVARIVWGAVSLLVRNSSRLCSRHSFCTLGGMIVAFAYSALAGFSLPTTRALIMLSVIVLLTLIRRSSRTGHACSLAMLIILLLDPLAVLSAGFWLSFVAVVGLIMGFAGLVCRQNRFLIAIRSQMLVWFGLIVPTLLFFGGVSLV